MNKNKSLVRTLFSLGLILIISTVAKAGMTGGVVLPSRCVDLRVNLTGLVAVEGEAAIISEIHNTNRKCGPALGRVYKDKPSIIKAAIDPDMIRPMSSLDLPMAQITFQRDGHSQKFTFRIVGRGIGTGFAVMEPVLNVRNRGENE